MRPHGEKFDFFLIAKPQVLNYHKKNFKNFLFQSCFRKVKRLTVCYKITSQAVWQVLFHLIEIFYSNFTSILRNLDQWIRAYERWCVSFWHFFFKLKFEK